MDVSICGFLRQYSLELAKSGHNWSGSGEAAAHPRTATVAPFPAWRVCSLAIARRPEPDKDCRLPICDCRLRSWHHNRRLAIGNRKSPGGEGGIRTHGTVSRTQHFQCCQLSHSCTSPKELPIVD
jgi:hypothetical protein